MKIDYSILQPLRSEILDKKNYLLQSITLHFIIILFLYYGIPNLFKYRSEFLPPLPIEIINISTKTASPKVNFTDIKEDEPKEKPNVKYNQDDEKTYQTKEIVESSEDAEVTLNKTEVKKIEKEKVIKVDKIKKKPNQLQSVLKSIEEFQKDIGEKKKTKKEDVKDETITPKKLGMTLTISEEDAIRRHFEKCWNIPSGAREVGNLAAEIKVWFNREGNVLDARISDVNRMKRDRYYRTAAESALRAVLNPRCKRAPLPPEKAAILLENLSLVQKMREIPRLTLKSIMTNKSLYL